ncbi:ribonuclease H2, subunit B [Cyathus striatus]|nr:ribonuclease H2, subunit B [Cyathus striatus]
MSVHLGVFPSDFVQSISAALGDQDSNVRCLRLPHPRTGIPSMFLPYNDIDSNSTLLEVQAVSPGSSRSWFLTEEIVSDGKLLIVTRMDPTFLLIPLLQKAHQNGMSGSFRPTYDIFEDITSSMKDDVISIQENKGEYAKIAPVSVDDIQFFLSLDCTHRGMKRICDVKDVSPKLTVYRFSLTKTLGFLQKKISRLLSSDVLGDSRAITRGFAKDGLMDDGKERLLNMARTRAACDLISQYLSPDVHKTLMASYDLQDLDSHLRQNVALAVSTAGNGALGKTKEKAVAATANDKKRKNAKGSHGVEKLKKVNVNGMAKLSSFFKKPEVS